MSYAMQQKRRDVRPSFRGFGVDNVTCDPGEVFDMTAMMCVQAGQATTPIYPPPGPAITPGPFPGAGIPGSTPPPPKTAPPGVQQASTFSGALPWVLGAVVVLAIGAAYMQDKG